MSLLEEASSLDDFFTEVLTPALKKRDVSLSSDAREHVVSVLVRFSHVVGDTDEEAGLVSSLTCRKSTYTFQAYTRARNNAQTLVDVGDNCLFRLGFGYAFTRFSGSYYGPEHYHRVGTASYARLAELFLDADMPSVAASFVELARNFDPVSLALTDIQVASLSDKQIFQICEKLDRVRDPRYVTLLKGSSPSPPVLFGPDVDVLPKEKKFYFESPGSNDNN